jgi:diguanylate cyclase (GGDEF)-like protein
LFPLAREHRGVVPKLLPCDFSNMSLASASLSANPRRSKATFLPSPWLSWIIALAICFSAALIGIEAWQLWQVHDTSLRHAKVVTASLAQSVSQQVEATLKTAETVVASLVQRVEADGTSPESLRRLYELMTTLAAALPAIHEMGIQDKYGNVIAKSHMMQPVGVNYRERDYFRYLSTHQGDKAFVGVPVKSKVDGSINITVSRRINEADGSFGGLVVTSVSMGFFQKLFESIQTKSNGLISLVSDNGMLLARSPDLMRNGESSLGSADLEFKALSDAPPDALDYVSPIAQVRRVASARHLDQYPVVAMVAQDSDQILRPWRAQVRIHGTIVLFILVVVASLSYRVDQANRATRMQALSDNLTGLANRRYLNHALDLEFRRAARNRHALSYIMADIDFFKSFNDRYGHPAGDACLRAVSTAIQGVLSRAGDMAARYGGEEIAILLPGTDVAGATDIAAEVQKAVSALAIPHAGSPYGIVTLSAGVASFSPAGPCATSQSLVQGADQALYMAKAKGRNAFVIHHGADTARGSFAPSAPA